MKDYTIEDAVGAALDAIEEMQRSIFSDVHKEARGFRPRGAAWDAFEALDADGRWELIDALTVEAHHAAELDAAEREAEERAAAEKMAHHAAALAEQAERDADEAFEARYPVPPQRVKARRYGRTVEGERPTHRGWERILHCGCCSGQRTWKRFRRTQYKARDCA